jgi:hypothetical protein
MEILKIHIAGFVPDAGKNDVLYRGAMILENYFRRAVEHGKKNIEHYFLADAKCFFNPNRGDLDGKELDLLLHVTPESFTHKYINNGKRDDAAGITYRTSDGVFSEVLWSFVKASSNPPLALANYACHELAHNKAYNIFNFDSERNSDFIHKQCGFGIFNDVVEPQVAGSIGINDVNIQKLAALCTFKMPQNTRILSKFGRR